LDAALQPSHKCSSIPAELNDPRTLNLASLMLREIARASSNGAGIGWCMILKSIAGNVAVSQNIIKRCLRLLNRLGYTQSGVTRQGTKITSKGIEFLDRLSR
jgi:predicted transcriptional regulator